MLGRVQGDLLRIPQVARELGVSRTKAYQLITRAQDPLPSVRLGPRLTVVPRAALEAWIEGLTRAALEGTAR